MKGVADLISALATILWPAIIAVVVWRLFPLIRGIIEGRDFSVEVAGTTISVQRASDALAAQIDDLRSSIIELRGQAASGSSAQSSDRILNRVLWVDDRPHANAYEIASLGRRGTSVSRALATDEAMLLFRSANFDLIVSDLHRIESGRENPRAGFDLTREIREAGHQLPIIIYTGPTSAELGQEVTHAGAQAITSSPTELFQLIRQHGRFPNEVE